MSSNSTGADKRVVGEGKEGLPAQVRNVSRNTVYLDQHPNVASTLSCPKTFDTFCATGDSEVTGAFNPNNVRRNIVPVSWGVKHKVQN